MNHLSYYNGLCFPHDSGNDSRPALYYPWPIKFLLRNSFAHFRLNHVILHAFLIFTISLVHILQRCKCFVLCRQFKICLNTFVHHVIWKHHVQCFKSFIIFNDTCLDFLLLFINNIEWEWWQHTQTVHWTDEHFYVCSWLITCVFIVLFVWETQGFSHDFPNQLLLGNPGLKEIGRERWEIGSGCLVGQFFCVWGQREGSCDFVSNVLT